MDAKTTVETLKRQVCDFRDARDWLKYDTPRSLAISIIIEAAELLEHFQWKNDEQIREVLLDPEKRDLIADELADVMIYCLGFSDVLGIDVSDAVARKLHKSGEKDPATRLSQRH
jgi:NTP pyrophosphatase (non-canonical NTP hydrolase)